jgi:predicted negative regulator of RcsB-dependent stress response
VDDYLSEKEQLDAIREWWREYGWYLLGGVIVGVAILTGYRQYGNYQLDQAEAASALYQELRTAISDDADAEALSVLEQLRSDYASSAYADQAGMLITVMHLSNQSARLAIDELRYVLDTTSDDHLSLVATGRLARLLVSAGREDEALTVLDSVEARSFSARFSEIRGDIYYAQGNFDSARNAYSEALNGEQADIVDRGLVQMKLDDLPRANTPALEDAGG